MLPLLAVGIRSATHLMVEPKPGKEVAKQMGTLRSTGFSLAAAWAIEPPEITISKNRKRTIKVIFLIVMSPFF
jgi:hypothetical protein